MAETNVPEGQNALETPNTGIGNTAGGQEPFLKIDDSTFFNTPDEAVKAFQEGTQRHSEHKKAMSALEEDRRRHENEKALWIRQQSEWDDKIKLYKQADELFKANPRAFQTVKQMLRQGAGREDIQELIDKAVKQKLGPIEENEKRRSAQEERNRYFTELKERLPDLDEKAVSSLYDQLMSPEANMGTLIEMLHYANRGKGIDPTQIQKETINNLEKKSKAGIPSVKGAGYSAKKEVNKLNMKQLAEKLKRETGG